MRLHCLFLFVLAGLAAAEEFPRPSERLRALPGDDWLPRRERSSLHCAWERPLPDLPLWLTEFSLRQAIGSRLAVDGWLWALDSELIDRRAVGLGATLALSAMTWSVRAREQWLVLEKESEARRRHTDVAVAWGEESWRAGIRSRLRRRELWLDWALQLRQRAVTLATEREHSPFGGEALWKFGCQAELAPALALGAQWRPQGTDLVLAVRRRALRLSIALAASGIDQGGVAVGTEWLR